MIRKLLLLVVLSLFSAVPSWAACPGSGQSRTVSANTTTEIQSCIDAVSDGGTVTLLSGSTTLTTGITISGKWIHLVGGGSGRVIGRSASSVAVGTGAKTFTTQAGLSISNGQTLTIERTGTVISGGQPTGTRTWMSGTVTSYSGTTLVMNITSTAGSGTEQVWIISTQPTTTITRQMVDTDLITVTESTVGSTEISGIKFLWGTGDGGSYLVVNGVSSGKPILFHDNYGELQTSNTGGTRPSFGTFWGVSRGVTWNNSWAAFGFTETNQPYGIFATGFDAWTSASTMGTDDSTGASNFYAEDSDFHAILNTIDADENARVVFRHNLLDNSGFGSHGADTSNYGVRHYEITDDEFTYNGFSDGTSMNVDYRIFLRGGTGVITDNTFTLVTAGYGSDYGHKGEIRATVENLSRSSGPNPCWGANIVGNQYPAPRQVGMGRVTGAAGNDSITYKGDSEPLYVWNNTAALGGYSFTVDDQDLGQCTSRDLPSNYIVSGRDFFLDAGAKPSYTKSTYPNPLRTDLGGDVTGPVFGASGAITFSGVSSSAITVNWTKATDETTSQGSLQYEVCRSTSTISSVGTCESNIVLTFTTDIALFSDTGLSSSTTYHYNLVVKDAAGNKTLYVDNSQATTSGAVASIASILPVSGGRGKSVAIVVTGTSTNFQSGVSVCSFSPASGITVTSTTVASATSATCNVTIANGAGLSTRAIRITTGSEYADLSSAFQVIGGGTMLRGLRR